MDVFVGEVSSRKVIVYLVLINSRGQLLVQFHGIDCCRQVGRAFYEGGKRSRELGREEGMLEEETKEKNLYRTDYMAIGYTES